MRWSLLRGRACTLTRPAVVCLLAMAAGACAPSRAPLGTPSAELARYLAAVNQKAGSLQPAPPSTRAASLEETNADLKEARLLAEATPTPVNQRHLGEVYLRLGVFDAAYDRFTRALAGDPRDGRAFDGRARVWRAWGLPALGINDAYRAIYYAPGDPGPLNTLGTLLLRLGLLRDARRTFEQAMTTAPEAGYALNNLCYADMLAGDTRAVASCERAVAAQPGAASPRMNLALAYAAAGDLDRAQVFAPAQESPALAAYDLGTALMALGRFPGAAAAFDRAVALNAAFTLAAERARQARAQMAMGLSPVRP